jgi:hypothetical protein
VSSLGDRKGLDSVQSNPLYEQSGSQGTNPLYEPKNARTIAVGDLNGDGRDELIGLDIRTDGTPATVSCQQLEKAWPVRYEGPRFNAEEGVVPRSAVTVSVGDINGDGADDLIVAPNKSGDPWFFGISAKQADGHTKLVWSPRSNIDL